MIHRCPDSPCGPRPRYLDEEPPKNLLKEFFKSFTSDSMAPSFLVVHTQAANSAGNVVEAEVVVKDN